MGCHNTPDKNYKTLNSGYYATWVEIYRCFFGGPVLICERGLQFCSLEQYDWRSKYGSSFPRSPKEIIKEMLLINI